jgi:hypothetical protein
MFAALSRGHRLAGRLGAARRSARRALVIGGGYDSLAGRNAWACLGFP